MGKKRDCLISSATILYTKQLPALWEASNLLLFHTPHPVTRRTVPLTQKNPYSGKELKLLLKKPNAWKNPQAKPNRSLWNFLEMRKHLTLFFKSCSGNRKALNSEPLKAAPMIVQLLFVTWIKKCLSYLLNKMSIFFLMTSGLVNVHITTKHKRT